MSDVPLPAAWYESRVMDAADPLWQWDVHNDRIVLNPESAGLLHGRTEKAYRGRCGAFCDGLAADRQESVRQLFSSLRRSSSDSAMEILQTVGEDIICCRAIVLERQMDVIMSPRYGDSYEQSFRMLKADGTYCWILSRARVLRRNAHGRATRLIGLHTDITTTQGERDRLAEMIEYDPLTDVHSLVYFHNELDRLDMQPGKVVSIISCDVNGLKLINDYLGHDTGNSMLQTAARLLRSSLRSTDCVARLGGDEFAVLLPRCNLRDAARVLEKIREVFRHYNEHSGNVPVIMSFGLSGSEEAASLREVLALADRRMLHEKHGSRLVSGHAIKAWIEKRKDCVVSLEESRYDG